MPALPSSLISSLSVAPALTVSETAGGLLVALAGVPDPRARRGVRHRLCPVVAAVVCAVVAVAVFTVELPAVGVDLQVEVHQLIDAPARLFGIVVVQPHVGRYGVIAFSADVVRSANGVQRVP